MSRYVLTRMIGKVVLYSVCSIALIMGAIVLLVAEELTTLLSVDPPESVATLPDGVTAQAWGVFDPHTGRVLMGKNTNDAYPIASITKLFTAETVLMSDHRDEEFVINFSDVSTEGRAGKLSYGDRMTAYELLFPLLIESSNDAAMAIRRHLGQEYDHAVQGVISTLSLDETRIVEPSGLSPDNVSSVQNLSTFFSYLRQAYPHVLDITRLDTYVGEYTGYRNSNPAQKLSGFTGGKQGYIDAAGKTFVGTYVQSDKELGVVVLGSTDLVGDITAILGAQDRKVVLQHRSLELP